MALPGPFLPGQRLAAGQLNDATQKTLASVDVNVTGVILDNVTTTETTITQLTLGPFDQVVGGLYKVVPRVIVQQPNADDEFRMIMRKNIPLTGTIIADWNMWRFISDGKAMLFHTYADFVGTANESVVYYFSVVRFLGTNKLTVYGHHTSNTPTGATIMRTGYASEFTVVT